MCASVGICILEFMFFKKGRNGAAVRQTNGETDRETDGQADKHRRINRRTDTGTIKNTQMSSDRYDAQNKRLQKTADLFHVEFVRVMVVHRRVAAG